MFQENKQLSPEELFKYRLPRDKTVPQKGGSKEYAPDGSWLQSKQLEAFHQERKAVLSEQRVEKIGSLVRGEWNPEAGLVEFKKEMGKFWSHMGFVDSSRKWLYPEEALYLMETLVFEVYYKGVALSIQEAYVHFLGTSLELEEYQVYAHLRRLGYVVLRHRGKSDVTSYERKIKLDQHVKHLKHRKRKMEEKPKFISEAKAGQAKIDPLDVEKKPKLLKDQSRGDNQDEDKLEAMDVDDTVIREEVKMATNNHALGLHCETEDISPSASVNNAKSFATNSGIENVWKITNRTDLESQKDPKIKHRMWNFDEFDFPDIANKERVILKIPSKKFLPPNVEVSEEFDDLCIFDVLEYRRSVGYNHGNISERKQQRDLYLQDLHFSYSDWMQSRPKIQASNWTEYKKKLREKTASSLEETPVGHLWEGEVTPLVRPEDATSTVNILNKLCVIQSFKPGKLKEAVPVKISFDVFLPDAKFKKSSPGLPNHRVCVTRSSDRPPSLADLTMTTEKLEEGVPIHWAVVDNGEIAFYSFSNISLPVDISMG